MILSGKTSWIRGSIETHGVCAVQRRPRMVYIQDIIDLPSCRFFVTDGHHFVACTVEKTAFDHCMGKYAMESVSLKGSLMSVTVYEFTVDRKSRIEMCVEGCIYFGEGNIAEDTIDINDAMVRVPRAGNRPGTIEEDPDDPLPGEANGIDFGEVKKLVTGPVYSYLIDRLLEDYDCCSGADVQTGSLLISSDQNELIEELFDADSILSGPDAGPALDPPASGVSGEFKDFRPYRLGTAPSELSGSKREAWEKTCPEDSVGSREGRGCADLLEDRGYIDLLEDGTDPQRRTPGMYLLL